MKIYLIAFTVSISLCASFCCPEEDDFFPLKEIANNTIISINDNKKVFDLGEQIFINTTFSNEQTTLDGETILLSDYNNNNDNIRCTFALYKETNFGTLVKISVTDNNIEVINGNTYTDRHWINAENTFKDNKFSSVFGITLLESGTYYITGTNYDFDNDGIVWFYISDVNLASKIINSEDDGAYKFTVNP
ncbi:hypothetical protein ACKGJY_02030 [Hyunsoonleella sp. 2307UL5-6]|uniref:hypothetical protein n=1 Tax=Hyunsoonleella sp. 2307UL5-6 TaxID=3384768 RepID=UPI0039BC33A6